MSVLSRDLIGISADNLGLQTMRVSFISGNANSFQTGTTNIGGTTVGNLSIRATDGMVSVNQSGIASTGSTPTSITLPDFTSGSHAAVGGLNPQDFTLSYQNTANGTLQVIATPDAGGAPTTVNLPGYSTADLSDGRLSARFATTTTGTPYLDIHAT